MSDAVFCMFIVTFYRSQPMQLGDQLFEHFTYLNAPRS